MVCVQVAAVDGEYALVNEPWCGVLSEVINMNLEYRIFEIALVNEPICGCRW
jgi:hypothetical protein